MANRNHIGRGALGVGNPHQNRHILASRNTKGRHWRLVTTSSGGYEAPTGGTQPTTNNVLARTLALSQVPRAGDNLKITVGWRAIFIDGSGFKEYHVGNMSAHCAIGTDTGKSTWTMVDGTHLITISDPGSLGDISTSTPEIFTDNDTTGEITDGNLVTLHATGNNYTTGLTCHFGSTRDLINVVIWSDQTVGAVLTTLGLATAVWADWIPA